MVDLSAVLAFSVAAALLTITPGLDTALVLRTAAVEGPRSARMASVGICSGLLVWGSATAFGLTALLALSHLAFDTLRIAGAVYLAYLGARMWLNRRDFRTELSNQASDPTPAKGAHQWFMRGLLSNVLNPKAGVFYITLLPQFIPHGASIVSYSLGFTFIHVFEGLIWLTLLTVAVGPLRGWLTRPGVTHGLNCTTGTVLIGAGLALAFEKRR